MAAIDNEPNEEWAKVSGWVLFAILLLIAANFILFPGEGPSTTSLSHRCTRISPFHCAYDILHRLIEVSFLLIDGHRHDHAEYSWDVSIRLDGGSTWPGLLSRMVTTFSLLVLYTLRNAFYTQIFATLYLTHWLLVHSLALHQNRSSDRTDSLVRSTGVLFAMLCHWTLPGMSTTDPPPTHFAILVDGIVAGIIATSAMFFSSCSMNPERDHDALALIAQTCFLGFAGFTWLLAYGPLALIREPLPCDATDMMYLFDRLLPAMEFHVGLIGFLSSRRNLELVRPVVRAVVGLLWVAAGAWYYCHFYGVYDVGFHLPVAEIRTTHWRSGKEAL